MTGKLQDFNQRLSEAGLPAFVPDADTELQAEAIAGSNAETDATLERYSGQYAQAYAAEMWLNVWSAWDAIGELPGVQIPEDTTRMDGRDPALSTLWVVVDRPPYQRIAIAQLGDYKAVAAEQLARVHYCMAGVSKRCAGKFESVAVANGLVARGELPPSELAGELDVYDDRVAFDRARIARKLAALRDPVLPFTARYFRHKRGQFIVVSKVCSVCGDFLRDDGPVEDEARLFGTVAWPYDPLHNPEYPNSVVVRPAPSDSNP